MRATVPRLGRSGKKANNTTRPLVKAEMIAKGQLTLDEDKGPSQGGLLSTENHEDNKQSKRTRPSR